jgi:hypothetical protein
MLKTASLTLLTVGTGVLAAAIGYTVEAGAVAVRVRAVV